MIAKSALEAVPDDIKAHPQWVCFTRNKVPFHPVTHDPAIAGDASTWGTYWDAVCSAQNRSNYVGIGYEFLPEQNITGIDLDHCAIDGRLTPFAQDVVDRLDSYTEYSPSETGIHILVYGSLERSLAFKEKENGVEMYDRERYFTITGNHLTGTPTTIEHRQEALDWLFQSVLQRQQALKEEKWQERLAKTANMGRYEPFNGNSHYGLAALEQECFELSTTGNGNRNNQLNASAFSLGQLIGGNELDYHEAYDRLYDAACTTGLPEREIEKTLRRALEDGQQHPRSRPIQAQIRATPLVVDHPFFSGNIPEKQAKLNLACAKVSDEQLCSFDADDSGNGDAMHVLFGESFLYCKARGWFVYHEGYWQLDSDESIVKRHAVTTLRKRRHAGVEKDNEVVIKCAKANEKEVNGCMNRFKTLVSANIDEFDNAPDAINCKNGVVDLRTGTLTAHNRQQRFTYCIPVDYEASDSLVWIDYLHGVIGGEQEVIDYLQMALGYSFTGHTREEILFYLFGPTRSGKGTVAEVIMALLPTPIATMVDFNSFTAKREGDTSNFDLAPLKPSRVIFASESNRSQSLNPAKIKQLTGGDRVRACFKHKDHFEYKPQFKMWMMSNHPVNGDPEDDALWGRVKVIPFPNSYLGCEDKNKKADLKKEENLKGVLYWIVQGAMRWYALGSKGLETPETVRTTTQKHRDDLDYVQQWLDETCEKEEGAWTSNEMVAANYSNWCKNNNVQYPKGPKALAQSLKSKGYEPSMVKKIGEKTYRGVGRLRIFEM